MVLDVALGREAPLDTVALIGPRPLEQQGVNRRRVLDEPLEQRRLPTVCAQIPRVEEAAPGGSDVERVCVERRVIDEVGRHFERSGREWPSVSEEAVGLKCDPSWGEEGRFLQDARGRLADAYGNRRRDGFHKSVVIRVAVRDDDAAQGIVRPLEPGDRWQRDIILRFDVKRAAEIQHQALAATLKLDAATADLSRSAMDARSKHARTIRGREQLASAPETESPSPVAYARSATALSRAPNERRAGLSEIEADCRAGLISASAVSFAPWPWSGSTRRGCSAC